VQRLLEIVGAVAFPDGVDRDRGVGGQDRAYGALVLVEGIGVAGVEVERADGALLDEQPEREHAAPPVSSAAW
jgi:2-methylisocitrate lyase-like PEP mutase family enzyme